MSLANTSSFQIGLTAAGTSQATALALSPASFFNQISTAAASSGVMLSSSSYIGQRYSILNDGANFDISACGRSNKFTR